MSKLKLLDYEAIQVDIKISKKDLQVFYNVLNIVCNDIYIGLFEFETRIGLPFEEAKELKAKVREIIDKFI